MRCERVAEQDPGAPAGVFAAVAIANAQTATPAAEIVGPARRARAGRERRGLGWATGLVALFTALLFAEHYDEAEELVEEGFAIARSRGSEIHFAMCSAMRSCLALRRGALGDAEEDARVALQAAPRQAHGFYGMFALASLLEALVERGLPAEAERELARIGLPERSSALTYAPLLNARGRLRLAQGRTEEALEDFLAAGRHLLRGECTTPSAAAWRSGAAARAARARRPGGRPSARGRGGRARPDGGFSARARHRPARRGARHGWRERPRAPGGLGRVARALAGAARAWQVARRAWCAAQARRTPEGRARAAAPRARSGQSLRRGRARRAGPHRAPRAPAARPRQGALSGPAAHSPRASGVSRRWPRRVSANREIAQALFVSLRTVETHLTHAFQKLDIDSRTKLADALRGTTT